MGDHVKNPIGQFNEAEVESPVEHRRARAVGMERPRRPTPRNVAGADALTSSNRWRRRRAGTMADFLHIRVRLLDPRAHAPGRREMAGHLSGGPAGTLSIG
jgi:hypothetical protein